MTSEPYTCRCGRTVFVRIRDGQPGRYYAEFRDDSQRETATCHCGANLYEQLAHGRLRPVDSRREAVPA